MSRDDPSTGEIHALLGIGTEFKGRLVFDGRVRIDGRFSGEISSDGTLVLGEASNVDATIDVGVLVVRGGVLKGTVRAREVVEIHAPATVHADVTAPEVSIEKGAHFEGACRMTG